MPLISIACVNQLNVLGSSTSRKMLWRDKQDLKFFSTLSKQYTNIVTKSTILSMPPLADRNFLITTRTPNLANEYTFEDLKAILETQQSTHLNIGGLTLYRELLDLTDHFVVCTVNNYISGDLYLEDDILAEFSTKKNLYKSPSYCIDLYSRLGQQLNLTQTLKTWQQN